MRRVNRFVSAASIGAALVVAFAVPGYATTIVTAVPAIPSSCPSGDVCIYANANFAAGPGVFSGTNSSWGADLPSSGECVPGKTAAPDNKGGWNDCVSSIANNTNKPFFFYIDVNCGGAHPIELLPGDQFSNLDTALNGEPGGFYNDAISSDSQSSTAVTC